MLLFTGLVAFLSLWTHVANAAFGYTSSGGYYTIDAGSANPLVFKVNQANCDITSLVFRGTQACGVTPISRTHSLICPLFSSINMDRHFLILVLVWGRPLYRLQLSAVCINAGKSMLVTKHVSLGTYIKVTCVTSTLTHYYVVKSVSLDPAEEAPTNLCLDLGRLYYLHGHIHRTLRNSSFDLDSLLTYRFSLPNPQSANCDTSSALRDRYSPPATLKATLTSALLLSKDQMCSRIALDIPTANSSQGMFLNSKKKTG